MTPFKVKIFGSGRAAKRHMDAYAKLPEMFQVVDEDQDIIDICTPNFLHFGEASWALLSGYHVIVEKPVCGSLAEVDDLRELEWETEKLVCPIAQYRYEPQLAKFVVPPVQLSNVVGISSVLIQKPRSPSYFEDWHGDPDQALGGCLAMQGIHAIDLILHLIGSVKSVRASIPGRQHHGIEDFCYVVLEMVNGASVRLEVSTPSVCEPLFSFNGLHLENSTDMFVEQFRRMHKPFNDIYEGNRVFGDKLPVTLSQARNAIEVLTAAYYSAYDGDTVTLPIADAHPAYQGYL